MSDVSTIDMENHETEQNRKFKINIPDPVKNHWPLGFLAIGLAALGTGAGLAGADHAWAAIPVGTSNLSMVLSLSGASLALLSLWVWYGTSKKLTNDDGKIAAFGIVMTAILGLAAAGAGYAGVHYGMANLAKLLSVDIGQSLGEQFAIGLGMGALLGALLCSGLMLSDGPEKFVTNTKKNKVFIPTLVVSSGLICAFATTAGPALSLALGQAAENAIERIAMEAIIAVGIGSLVLLALMVSQKAQEAWDNWTPSRGGGQRPIPENEALL